MYISRSASSTFPITSSYRFEDLGFELALAVSENLKALDLACRGQLKD
jgi:hypothetical protein